MPPTNESEARVTLTRYEVTKIVGLRALQLEQDACPFIDVQPHEPFLNVAVKELFRRKLDVKVVRGKRSYHISQVDFPQELYALVDVQQGTETESGFLSLPSETVASS